VLAVMLWMNVVSQVLFFGAELCKVVATRGGVLDVTSRRRSRWTRSIPSKIASSAGG
jgi:uncharacterized BrkB/YihY/UPF0761 family membrane protein